MNVDYRTLLSNLSSLLFKAAGEPETGTREEFACVIFDYLSSEMDLPELFSGIREEIDAWEKALNLNHVHLEGEQ